MIRKTDETPPPGKVFSVNSAHADAARLRAGLVHVLASPADRGVLEMIVCRPAEDQRRVLPAGELSLSEGLVGDSWRRRGSSETADEADPQTQITLMNSRVAQLVSGARARWPLAGDQLYVDLDLSQASLPPGSCLRIGDAFLQITPEPHAGCEKFAQRFGRAAMIWVNSRLGRRLNLRGVYARVLCGGNVRSGQAVEVCRQMSSVS